jgi:hypothetical protein
MWHGHAGIDKWIGLVWTDIGFMGEIVVLCHWTRARLFERSSRDEKPSPLLDDDAFLPFQGKGVDSSASSALTP